jgi:hypothetical protein
MLREAAYQNNADKVHLESTQNAKEPYTKKGYTQNIRTQKPKKTLKNKLINSLILK